MDFKEIKDAIDAQNRAFEEFKKTNDERLAKLAKGESVTDLDAKLVKINAELDKQGEIKSRLDALEIKLNRPNFGDQAADKDAVAELKGFNVLLRADRQTKGVATIEFDAKTYADYKSGFFKAMAGVPVATLPSEEQKALSAGSDADGGYLLPHSTIGKVVTKLYEQSIMRQICDVQTISTAKIEGVVDNDEADAGWVAELGTRSDSDTPQVGKWEIEAHEVYAMPKASQKLIDDAATDIEGWLAAKIADKIGRVEGTAFWQGTGVGQPRGLATYTTAATADDSRAWGTFEHVVSGASADWHTTQFDPVHTLMGAMKDHFLPNAQFVMRRAVRTSARKLKESTTNRYLWEPGMQVGQPERLMGYPCRVDEYMPTLAADSLSFAFGDFKQAYKIVDRLGIRTLRDPFTAKPYVVFYSTKRVGGGAQNSESVKFIKFGT